MLKHLLFATLISFSAYAGQGCFKELCVGDIVRDKFGWHGRVDSFDLHNEQVMVSLSHIPSVWPFPYSELGKRVFCHQWICQGQTVIDKYNEEVEVWEVYTHGMVYVFDSNIDGHLLYMIEDLSPKK